MKRIREKQPNTETMEPSQALELKPFVPSKEPKNNIPIKTNIPDNGGCDTVL